MAVIVMAAILLVKAIAAMALKPYIRGAPDSVEKGRVPGS